MKNIYLDHAATTPVDSLVVEEMTPYFTKYFGNPSSLHSVGSKAKESLEEAREKVAKVVEAKYDEIIFTSGGTESDNIALKGIAYAHKNKRNTKGPHIITSSIEHPAILETCKHLEQQGFVIDYLPVDKYGLVNPKDIENTITKDTFLVSIIYANNEIGTIEPIKEIGEITKDRQTLLHTDAVQAVGKTPLDVTELNVDLLTLSSHKIYGPKGVGGLFIKKGLKVTPFLQGGGHEKGIRSGTENIPGIVGFGKACELSKRRMQKDNHHIKKLRDKLIKNITPIEESYLNGHPEKRLSNNAHFRFTAIEGESLLLSLDAKGISASTGSACSSTKLQASHVLMAIGLKEVEAHGSLRLSLGRENTNEEIEYVLGVIPDIVDNLRKMSPLWKKK